VDVCLAGGVESVSTAPWRVDKPATLYQTPAFSDRARFAPDSPDAAGDPDMGPAADALARAHGVSRARQDQFAIDSHRKAIAATRDGRFEGEIVPLPASNRAAAGPAPAGGWVDPIIVDQSPRAGLTLRSLSRFPPVFTPNGTVTAGNSSPINDGAAIVAVVSAAVHRRLAPQAALRVVDGVAAGVDPAMPGAGPIAATQALCKRVANLDLNDVDLVELTEAFAGQALACVDALGIAEERLNVAGGAIALGHPWGASGAVLVTRLFTEMVRDPRSPASEPTPRYGLATVAGAGGLGVATLFERT
jgi:acetyl-CoA C-acetyltransferase